ncbi:hypothetical protein AtubIFM57258_008549 [Aspergillus tubingensis]|nr:hypothetical protein AtubIFM57258_008549 [Aspergillus tubingensis]
MVPRTRRSETLKRAASVDPEPARPGDETPPESKRVYPTDYYFGTREEYSDFFTQLTRMSSAALFRRGYPELMHDEFNQLHISLRNWTWTFGVTEEESHLSKDDKQEIIASLKGQCVQEDWDSIKALCPPAARRSLCDVLLEAMLYQFIFVTLIDSPFWFMDGKIDPTDMDGDPQFHRRFQHLYERLRAGNGFGAAWLKSAVISESNAQNIHGGTVEEMELARCNAARRKALVMQFRDELLGRRVFQLLLRPLESKAEIAHRSGGLHRILEQAVYAVIYTEGGIYGNSVIYRLPDMSVFNYNSDNMVGHTYHGTSSNRTPDCAAAPGGRVLIVTRPGLTYVDIESFGQLGRRPPYRLLPAEVVVEVIKKKQASTKSRPKTKPKTTSRNKSKKPSGPDLQSNSMPETSKSASTSQAASAPEVEDNTTPSEQNEPLGKLIPPLRKSFWRE